MGAVEFTEVICPSWIQENALSLGERSADAPGLDLRELQGGEELHSHWGEKGKLCVHTRQLHRGETLPVFTLVQGND